MRHQIPTAVIRRRLQLLLPLLVVVAIAHGQSPTGPALITALRHGGYVILMRHASSPRTPPDPGHADSGNVHHERQLDEPGRATARALGAAFRQLHIPIGQVLSSPTYRALETIRLAQLRAPKIDSHLGDSGQSMQGEASGTRAAWLREKVAERPAAGTNTMMVTHFPNINEAFPNDSTGLDDGEALIFHPNGHGAAAFIARVKIHEWPQLAATRLDAQ
jgi:phosphohistidine phosphatase SixA